jgi:hypothetical protein
MYLYGMGLSPDPNRAAVLFLKAADDGQTDAMFSLANLSFTGIAGDREDATARDWLRRAAGGGPGPSDYNAGALRTLGFIHARTDSDHAQRLATTCFEKAALAGDALAEHVHALRCLRGQGTAASVERARYWLSRAASDGIALSARRLEALGGAPSPMPPRPAQDIRVGDAALKFDWPVRGPAALTRLSDEPRIEFTDDVLSEAECDYLIMLAEPQLRPSTTLDAGTGEVVASRLRTSRSMTFLPAARDIVLELIERRVAAVAGMPVEHVEPLAVLHYRQREEYKPHYDYFTDDAMTREPRLRKSGQRQVTAFVYLSDVEGGGGTDFPRLLKTLEPRRGRALVMHNCDRSGRPDPRTLHAGLPVLDGEKWLVTLWFRERAFVPV